MRSDVISKLTVYPALFWLLFLFCATCSCSATTTLTANQTLALAIDASLASAAKIPDTLFGIFFEEINHAGAGGIWAELVSNRGFEAGGSNVPSNIDPWSIIGNDSTIFVSTDRSSCFKQNIVALRMEVLCDNSGYNTCPSTGVGIYNPGYWGMNIEQGKVYKLMLFVRSFQPVSLAVSLTSSDGTKTLASAYMQAADVSSWTKVELQLLAQASNQNARLQITTTQKGVIWFDQVSLMPSDTYKGHGFRKELFFMLADLKPRFLRFPGGCYVEGNWLRNAFRWKESVGPWQERPGHFGDVWNYWSDDGFGYFEYLQLAEDLGAQPVWVVNSGLSLHDQVDTTAIFPFVEEALQSIEFARGSPTSTWGSVRAAMGHPDPFPLKYIATGNENCGMKNYRGNYLKFYQAIKGAYPDIQIISNCDGSSTPLDHPADFYDFHVYTTAKTLFSMKDQFNHAPRGGPKAFVSEYAVWRDDAGKGSLLASLGEAAFLIGLEKNSDLVQMASYAPLFVNDNDRTWNPDAIVFNSWQQYGTPSYWMQQFFRDSSGSTFHPSSFGPGDASLLAASAVQWQSQDNNVNFLKLKVVNFGANPAELTITISGLQANINPAKSFKTVLTSSNVMDENSFSQPRKVVPVQTPLSSAAKAMDVVVSPYSITSFDLALDQATLADI